MGLGTTLVLVALAAGQPQWVGARPVRANRIVSLAPSATELLFALGAGDRVVGVTRFDDEPASVRELPKVGGFIDPDPEAILALEPDMAVAVPTSGGRGRIDTIARLGVPVLVLPGKSIDDLWVALDALAQVTGRTTAAAKLGAEMRGRIETVRSTYASAPRVHALVVVGRRPLIAAGKGTFLDEALSVFGAENAVRRGGSYPQLDFEAIVALDPDVIIDVTMTATPDPDFWNRAPGIRAVGSGRVIYLQDDAVLRPGPRLPGGLEALARAVRATSE